MNVNTDIGGRSPLHYAADFGQTEVLQYLVSKGANANAKDKHGITVILAAIWEGHTECVKFLLQKVNFRIEQNEISYLCIYFTSSLKSIKLMYDQL